mmetsp:Transcript_33708/g.75680  ORF Transcript_33708/g.75680 Transcript_33708/m.75680 type:complete len:384 (-) Transcript_33708:46-1197(-)
MTRTAFRRCGFSLLCIAVAGATDECQDEAALLQAQLTGASPRLTGGRLLEPVVAGQKHVKLFLNANLHVVGDVHMGMLRGCPVACEVTQDDMESADVVVWNARWMGPHTTPPALSSKPAHQKWVFNFDAEAPVYGGMKVATRAVEALAPGMDWTFTFKSDSDFFKPYWALSAPSQLSMTEMQGNSHNWAQNKSKLLLWFVSNCAGKRMNVFTSLASLLPAELVETYGRCGKPHPCGRSIFNQQECIREVARPFKFYAAFENTRCDGYITEKLWTAFLYDMVPVVWGGLGRADYERLIPKDSFIHVDDFNSTTDLAKFLWELDKDDARYNKYFAWKASYHVASGLELFENSYCELCVEASKPSSQQRPSKKFGNLTDWWYSSCE